jgi:hypothetical protein
MSSFIPSPPTTPPLSPLTITAPFSPETIKLLKDETDFNQTSETYRYQVRNDKNQILGEEYDTVKGVTDAFNNLTMAGNYMITRTPFQEGEVPPANFQPVIVVKRVIKRVVIKDVKVAKSKGSPLENAEEIENQRLIDLYTTNGKKLFTTFSTPADIIKVIRSTLTRANRRITGYTKWKFFGAYYIIGKFHSVIQQDKDKGAEMWNYFKTKLAVTVVKENACLSEEEGDFDNDPNTEEQRLDFFQNSYSKDEDEESYDEYDDNDVLCHYSVTTGGWEAIEDHCVECGFVECRCLDIFKNLMIDANDCIRNGECLSPTLSRSIAMEYRNLVVEIGTEMDEMKEADKDILIDCLVSQIPAEKEVD